MAPQIWSVVICRNYLDIVQNSENRRDKAGNGTKKSRTTNTALSRARRPAESPRKPRVTPTWGKCPKEPPALLRMWKMPHGILF